MLECYDLASHTIDENNMDWHKPIEILENAVFKYKLENCIYAHSSNEDQWHKIKPLLNDKITVDENWVFIHWCNEVWRTNGYNKNNPLYKSYYASLLQQHGLLAEMSIRRQKFHDRGLIIIDIWEEFIQLM
jgi:hypothetical protein